MFGSKNKHRTKFNIDWSNVKPRHLNNFDINQKDEYECRPLFFACQWSELWVIQKLIDMGANINDEDTQFFGLQHRTGGGYYGFEGVSRGIEFIQLLIKNNARISPELIGTVLNYEMYQLIISSIDTNNITPEMGSKYICWLLNSYKPIYGKQSDKAYKRMPDSTNIISIMKNLAKLGAEPDSEMLYISTSTSVQQPDEVIGFLLDWNVGIDFEDDHTTHQILKPFNFAASYCGDNILKKFLLAGAEINPDDPIQSPLMFAIEDSNLSAVKFLLENGANPNCRIFNEYESIYGISALHMAISKTIMGDLHTHNIIQILLDYGADLNHPMIEDNKIVTPLDEALKHQSFHSQFNRNSRDDDRYDMSTKTVELLQSLGAKKTVYKTTRTLE